MEDRRGVGGLVDQVVLAVRRTTGAEPAPGRAGSGSETLGALVALRELRDLLQSWEPLLIETARAEGVSWTRLAPALGVTTRQAAERRYLRLRPGGDTGLTGEERVQATRDERAGDRAVAAWARDNASALRQIAGQVSAARGLSRSGRRSAKSLASSLTGDDPVALIAPLAEMRSHLLDEHAPLAAQVDEVGRKVRRVRRETQRRRGAPTQS